MIEYVLYIIGTRSVIGNKITVQGIFPNLCFAERVKNVMFPGSDVFVVKRTDVVFSDDGIDIPFFSKKI